MEFNFPLPGVEALAVYRWDRRIYEGLSKEEVFGIHQAVDTFGKNSAAAQRLARPVTQISHLSTDQRLYMICEKCGPNRSRILGGMKVGEKKLMMRKDNGTYEKISPTCVLDFYVHEKHQRHGFGHKLFECFLTNEGLKPIKVAYDRPSLKLKSFLQKHYGLTRYREQANNFVMFDDHSGEHSNPCTCTTKSQGVSPLMCKTTSTTKDPTHSDERSPSPMVPRTPAHGPSKRITMRRSTSPSLPSDHEPESFHPRQPWHVPRKPAEDRILFSTENPTPLKVRDRSKRGILDAAHDSLTMTTILSKVKHSSIGKAAMKKDQSAISYPTLPRSTHYSSAKPGNTLRVKDSEIGRQRRGKSPTEPLLGRYTMLSPQHFLGNMNRTGTGCQIESCRSASAQSRLDSMAKIAPRPKNTQGSCAQQPLSGSTTPQSFGARSEPPWAVDYVHGIQSRSHHIKNSSRQILHTRTVRQPLRSTGVGHCLDWR